MLKIAWSEIYAHPLPDGHRFPMAKYNLLPEQLLYEGTVNHENFFAPSKLDDDSILLTHDENYLKKLYHKTLSYKEIRATGFPLSDKLVEREITIMNGTVLAARFAMKYGVAMNIAGGTHHAFRDRGEGFCLLNDLAIAANVLLNEKIVSKVMIVDLDVHQGNGTASIFENSENVFTFSMHGAGNYPLHKEKSHLDIPLPDGIEDKAYLELLDKNLKQMFYAFEPEFIFYQSGVDVLKTDKLGKLGLSIEGCKQRDKLVFELAYQNQIPIVAAMGGGYSEKISDIIEAHANTFRLAQELFF